MSLSIPDTSSLYYFVPEKNLLVRLYICSFYICKKQDLDIFSSLSKITVLASGESKYQFKVYVIPNLWF